MKHTRTWSLQALLVLLAFSGYAFGDEIQGGRKVEFPSTAPGGDQETVFGYLVMPETVRSKIPAMVIVHGSGGVRDVREGRYARELASAGIAGFVTDSFTPRGVQSTVDDQTKVSSGQMVQDAFAALRFLAGDPRIDRDRIGIMGMSKGGVVALRTADRREQPPDLRFAVHIPIYPGCSDRYRNPRTTAPILMLLGENDDYAAPEPCRQYAESIRKAGGDITVITYPSAHHGFDGNDAQIREYRLANAQNFSNCLVNIEDDGRFVHARTGEVLETRQKYFAVLEKECMTWGATVATNPSAKRQSLEDILDFLKRTVLDSQARQ